MVDEVLEKKFEKQTNQAKQKMKELFDKHEQKVFDCGEEFIKKYKNTCHNLIEGSEEKTFDSASQLLKAMAGVKIKSDDFIFADNTKETYKKQYDALECCDVLNQCEDQLEKTIIFFHKAFVSVPFFYQRYKIIIKCKDFNEKYPNAIETFVEYCKEDMKAFVAYNQENIAGEQSIDIWKENIEKSKSTLVGNDAGEKIRQYVREKGIEDCYCISCAVEETWNECTGLGKEEDENVFLLKSFEMSNTELLPAVYQAKTNTEKTHKKAKVACVLSALGSFDILMLVLNLDHAGGLWGLFVALLCVTFGSYMVTKRNNPQVMAAFAEEKEKEFIKIYYEHLQELSDKYCEKYQEISKLAKEIKVITEINLEKFVEFKSDFTTKKQKVLSKILPQNLVNNSDLLHRIFNKMKAGNATNYKEALNLVENDIIRERYENEARRFREQQAEEERLNREHIMESQRRAEEYARQQADYAKRQAEYAKEQADYAKEQADNERKQAESLDRVREIEEERKRREDYDWMRR